jgi:type I pantothenate kinase
MSAATVGELSPYLAIERADWAELGRSTELPLTEAEIDSIRGLGDLLDLREVADVYLPLSQLLNIYAIQNQALHSRASEYFGERASRTPFIIGIAGSVAVGKSTVARLLRELMKRWPGTPRVELVTTDGFLYPNAELERRNLMHRKGFPESYDRRALLEFVSEIKSGRTDVSAPVYSHLAYDIVPGEFATVTTPDVLILEGLNVLQPPERGQELALSDFFDFTIFVDAEPENIREWFLSRFSRLWSSAFTDPRSYFHRLTTEMTEAQALERAKDIWQTINLPNLHENILPTRSRATLIVQKGPEHRVERVLLRKI